MLPGEDYEEVIDQAIAAARCVIAIGSDHAEAASFVSGALGQVTPVHGPR